MIATGRATLEPMTWQRDLASFLDAYQDPDTRPPVCVVRVGRLLSVRPIAVQEPNGEVTEYEVTTQWWQDEASQLALEGAEVKVSGVSQSNRPPKVIRVDRADRDLVGDPSSRLEWLARKWEGALRALASGD